MVKRIFVEKKQGLDIEGREYKADFTQRLQLNGVQNVRVIVRYDIEGIDDAQYSRARNTIFSEPQVDNCYDEEIDLSGCSRVFAVELLPGQYDQRADFAAQCLQILTQGEKPIVRAAKVIAISGEITDAEFEAVKKYCINPVESHEATLEKRQNLRENYQTPGDVEHIDGFIGLDKDGLEQLMAKMGLAMDLADITFCQQYFRDTEKRDPTITEIRMIDTYWSDHCRHTTFTTRLEQVEIEDGVMEGVYRDYIDTRKELGRTKAVCLMDVATLAIKKLKAAGRLTNMDESEEINACSIKVDVDVDGEPQKWLVMFKNETHNHPTEIEPFGGAATCLGGAIRDPLSGRVYVYQAMRVTGAGDPTVSMDKTLPGKLPQRKIVRTAAAGYSSYGNQIGLATGLVNEIYDEGYIAKRMEIGAVIGAAPAQNVVRERPADGDIVVLLGGRTGRDGCGGATGSSKAHTEESLSQCGAEVQKGNPPEERKLQRLFRNPEVTRMIKRCNDFGAGGVSVAIGELADGLEIDLDKVPKKYDGLDCTELAISESQERMAVVIAKENLEKFIAFASAENLEATKVADVNDTGRLVMKWRGGAVCDISREFLNTNGAEKQADVKVVKPDYSKNPFTVDNVENIEKQWLETIGSLNVCSQKGLVERFDGSIGAGSVFMPFGGTHQLTPQQCMAAKIPVLKGETTTGTLMAYGYNPTVAKWSPFHGAVYAVVESVSKIVAAGGDFRTAYLTFQEYFERLGTSPERWGKPLAALLGGYMAQCKLGIAAIGGKDSMSGSFNDIDVPPTLVSFAVDPVDVRKVVSGEFKKADSKVTLVPVNMDEQFLPDFDDLMQKYDHVHALIQEGKVLSAYVVTGGGLCEAVSKMAFGNGLGFDFADVPAQKLFAPMLGSIVLELADGAECGEVIGQTTNKAFITAGNASVSMAQLLECWQQPLEKVFPTKTGEPAEEVKTFTYTQRNTAAPKIGVAKPKVLIPVFPGTNCEYDSCRAFERAGAEIDVFPVLNLSPQAIEYSVQELSKRIGQSQIVMLAGGFSAGDEPDGSGKFIAAMFRNPKLKEDIHNLLYKRDGLMLGICNGFQALIKLGLVPFGEIRDMDENCPTLTYNAIGRHISTMARTRVASVKSPWFAGVNAGDIHTVALSHGEGRFVASPEVVKELADNGQIATQYVDLAGNPTGEMPYNPNGSIAGIEGITSADGRVLGKMGHSERRGPYVVQNVPGEKDQKIFESGVNYFKL